MFDISIFDLIWIGIVLLLTFAVAGKVRGRFVHGLAISAGMVAVVLHLLGYKVFGIPRVIDSCSLASPAEVVQLLPPSSIVLSDRPTNMFYGVQILKPIGVTETSPEGGRLIRMLKQPVDNQFSLRADLHPIGKSGVKGTVLRILNYPLSLSLFPKRLPRCQPQDLGVFLVQAGVGIPDPELFDRDPNYSAELMVPLRERAQHLPVSQGHPALAALGRKLVDRYPDDFLTGIYLMAAAGDINTPSLVSHKIDALLLRGPVVNLLTFYQEFLLFFDVLAQLDTTAAKAMADRLITTFPEKYPYLKVDVAIKMLEADEWAALDAIVAQLETNSLENMHFGTLGEALITQFQFYGSERQGFGRQDRIKAMTRWYRVMRPNLEWRNQPGQVGFALRGNPSIYDRTYFNSMREFQLQSKQ